MKNMSQTETMSKTQPYFSSSSYSVYHELADVPVKHATLEEEFVSRLALVEDLHKRFRFMVTELKTSGLRVDE